MEGSLLFFIISSLWISSYKIVLVIVLPFIQSIQKIDVIFPLNPGKETWNLIYGY